MKKYIYNIIFATMLCWVPALSSTPLEAAGEDAENQLTGAEAYIQAAMEELEIQLGELSDGITGVHRVFCKTDASGAEVTAQCGNNDTDNATEIKSVIIDYYTGGWYPVTEIAPDRGNLAVAPALITDFDLLDKEVLGTNPNGIATNTFDDKLCLEVHFKDGDEIEYVLPMWSGKTVVYCAYTQEKAEMINLAHVGANASAPNAEHKVLGEWGCFNPHEGFLNGGQAFGYDDKDADPSTTPTKAIPQREGLLEMCIVAVTPNV